MQYYIYMMTNASKTLYTGVTNDLERRVREHKTGTGSKFTSRYRIHKLAFYETYDDIRQAIVREKQIKGWLRSRKIALIEERNPQWRDLSVDWLEP